MTGRLAVLAATGIAAIGALSGCGAAEITAETTCGDYLAQPGDRRHDAAVRIASELGDPDAGPMSGLNLDYSCGTNRDAKISRYLARD